MSISKWEAMIYLTMEMGNADGEWSSEEMKESISKSEMFLEASENAPDWVEKVISRELNVKSAIYALMQLEREDRMECLISCLATAYADGEIDESEKAFLVELLSEFDDISVSELFEEYKSRM